MFIKGLVKLFTEDLRLLRVLVTAPMWTFKPLMDLEVNSHLIFRLHTYSPWYDEIDMIQHIIYPSHKRRKSN